MNIEIDYLWSHKCPKKWDQYTLIALVITIIVLLILAGLTIATLTGENGLLAKAAAAKEETKKAEALELMKTKIIEVQADKNGNATLSDFVEYLQNDTSTEYIISLTQTSSIKGTLPEGVNSAEKIYVTYNGFEFEITKNFQITLVGGTTSSDNSSSSSSGGSQSGGQTTGGGSGGTTAGECSRYIKVNISSAIMGSMTLSVDIPSTDKIKTIHYYVGNEEVHYGPEKTYTVTGLKNGETYNAYAIVDYDNKKETSTATILAAPQADIYVATTGDDTNGTGTADKPYATVAKAINEASSTEKTKIFIMPGEYTLTPMTDKSYPNGGLYDMEKPIEVFGLNEKTILIFDANNYTVTRDANGMNLANSNTIVRNLVYIFKPNNGQNYSRAIFGLGSQKTPEGKVSNVFFRISGSNKTAWSYHSYIQSDYCTFFHDMGSVDTSSYAGGLKFNNIATNVDTIGTKTNVQVQSFGSSSDTLDELITKSKNNSIFNTNQAGVFHGTNAWK